MSNNIIYCLQCNLTFSHKGNLRRHQKLKHPQENTVIVCNQVCGECNERCRTILDLHKHIEKEHPDIQLQFHKKVFYCQSDFDQWKAETERKTISSFTLHNTKKKEDAFVLHYRCHRTGPPLLKSDSYRIRRSKLSGSIKTGITCPAMMKITKQVFHEATQISVEYQSKHLGHKCEAEKLPFKISKYVENEEEKNTDYKSELLDVENYDLILIVGDQKIQAHRDILKSQSRVFDSMLSHDMMENNSSVIDISNCNLQAVKLFLSYMYCGRVDLDQSNMLELYGISYKFEMQGLKEECRSFIEESLSFSNISEVIQYALNHGDSGLLENATEYFIDNAVDILQTPECQLFMIDNPLVADELLNKSFEKKKQTEFSIKIEILD